MEALLVAFYLNGIRRHHKSHVVELARILNSLSSDQLDALGVRKWNPTEAYDRTDRFLPRPPLVAGRACIAFSVRHRRRAPPSLRCDARAPVIGPAR
ncbi:MAG: hypothetical protein WD206_01420 [Actinomycetota bacterium]